MIENIKKESTGTVSFDGKFKGMRKAQEFIVYPLHSGSSATSVQVQSDTRIGQIDLKSGVVALSPPIASGAYNPLADAV